jgi:hypothetical protein
MTNHANSGTVDRGFGAVLGQFSPGKRSTRRGDQRESAVKSRIYRVGA